MKLRVDVVKHGGDETISDKIEWVIRSVDFKYQQNNDPKQGELLKFISKKVGCQ